MRPVLGLRWSRKENSFTFELTGLISKAELERVRSTLNRMLDVAAENMTPEEPPSESSPQARIDKELGT